jgi:hypothetical protein
MIINGFFRENFFFFFSHQMSGKILEKYVFPSVNSSSNFSKIFSHKIAKFLYHKIENGKYPIDFMSHPTF